MKFVVCFALSLICATFLLAEKPPQAPPVRSAECTCQDADEADGCACVNCECTLCIGKPITIDESIDQTYDAIDKKLNRLLVGKERLPVQAPPVRTIAYKTPPVPIVETAYTAASVPQAPPLSVQDGGDSARLTEAYRRMTEAGYSIVEKDEVELCDTCPNGFLYTGKSFYTVEKSYDEGQAVSANPTTSSSSPSSGYASLPSSQRVYSTPAASYTTTYSNESSCGSDYSAAYSTSQPAYRVFYSTPTYSYSNEASCGSDYSGYSSQGYYRQPTYSAPVYSSPPRRFGSGIFGRLFGGGCLTGNCG